MKLFLRSFENQNYNTLNDSKHIQVLSNAHYSMRSNISYLTNLHIVKTYHHKHKLTMKNLNFFLSQPCTTISLSINIILYLENLYEFTDLSLSLIPSPSTLSYLSLKVQLIIKLKISKKKLSSH